MGAPSSQIRLLLVEDVTQVAQYIRNLLNAQDQVKLLDVLGDGKKVIDQIRELRPDVLMVDALLQGKMNGLEVAERVRQAGLDLPIICLTVPQKPIKVGPGMGVVKVLAMPFSGFDFMNALEAAHAEHRALAPDSLSRVYSVFAAKGGVGKTTIALNLAVAAAQLGGYRVALVDGSLQFADLRSLLRVPESAPSLLQLPTDRIAESDLQEVLWRDPSGIDILLAPPRVEMAEMVTTRDIEKALSLLRRVYNVVIIDTPT
ncbi:MAG: response regulator, partial [Chloroflexi bacterium]|nr:response regulator [Chloroflexota bacterium]